MHAGTLAAIQQHADDMCGVSGERIGAEMRRVLVSPHACEGLRQMLSSGIHRVVLPDLPGIDMERLEQSAAFGQSRRTFPLALACLAVSDWRTQDQRCRNVFLPGISQRWRLIQRGVASVRSSVSSIGRYWLNAKCLPWSTVQPTLILRDAHVILDLAAALAAVDGIEYRWL